jgi:hypothetical protein
MSGQSMLRVRLNDFENSANENMTLLCALCELWQRVGVRATDCTLLRITDTMHNVLQSSVHQEIFYGGGGGTKILYNSCLLSKSRL